jgi:hypothetical protein
MPRGSSSSRTRTRDSLTAAPGLRIASVEDEDAALVEQRRGEDVAVRLRTSYRNRLVMERRAPLIVPFLHGDNPEKGQGADKPCRVAQFPSQPKALLEQWHRLRAVASNDQEQRGLGTQHPGQGKRRLPGRRRLAWRTPATRPVGSHERQPGTRSPATDGVNSQSSEPESFTESEAPRWCTSGAEPCRSLP